MTRRDDWRLLPGLLVLAAQAGCHSSTPLGLPTLSPPSFTEGPTNAARELPPAEAARACAATADELFKKGQDAEAAALYEKARSLDPRQKHVCRRLGVLYDRLGNYQKAREEYAKALELAPKDSSVHSDLGYCHYCRGNWAEAERSLRRAVELDEKNARAWTNLGLTLAQQQRYEDALKAFSRGAPPAQAHANLAFVLTAQGKREEAALGYREALRLDPDLALARGALARLEAGDAAPEGPVAGGPAGDPRAAPPPPAQAPRARTTTTSPRAAAPRRSPPAPPAVLGPARADAGAQEVLDLPTQER